MARRAARAESTAQAAATVEPAAVEDGRRTIARLADDVLPMLIARLEQSDLGELEVRENGWRVRLRRVNGGTPPKATGSHRADARPSASPRQAGSAAPPSDGGQPPARPDPKRGLVVTSPAVGYFVAVDGMAVGRALEAGDLIGHIDVLGVRQDVVSTEGGVVRRLEVEPGQAVEYGQPIARVEPDKKG